METTRRQLLLNLLFGSGLLGLRSLATGIPISVLANPRRALAGQGDIPEGGVKPQYVILSTSGDGDPVGCNAPGTYLDPRILHPDMPAMAPASLTLDGTSHLAARPWSQLPQALLDRTCFFHHGTYTVVHSDEQKVLKLGGFTKQDEMFVSLLAARLAPALGTVQAEPLVLGPRQASETLLFQGRPQPIVTPSALALLLGPPTGPLGMLTRIRDRDLARLNAFVKRHSNRRQAAFLDQYAQSQTQLRSISEELLSVLEGITDDGPESQVTAAVTLIRLKVAPVISLHIPFGGDNHTDNGLMKEASETVSGAATLGKLWSQLQQTGLQDRVSFLLLNVFGRPLSPSDRSGRAHNQNHHVAVMFGPGFRGSVVGGVEPFDSDFGAMSINEKTGAGVPHDGGTIRFEETLQSMAHTFGRGIGLDSSSLSNYISGGRAVQAALKVA